MAWVQKRGVRPESIQPGKFQQNAYVERDCHTVRGEWLWTYINKRLNIGIGVMTLAMKLKAAE